MKAWGWGALILVFFTLMIGACRTQTKENSAPASTTEAMPASISLTAKFAPPDGQTLLIIGQDHETILAYSTAIPIPVPGGITSYTSLQRLEGIESLANNGSGNVFLNDLAEIYPESSIAVGLYLVNYLDEIVAGKADANIDRLLNYLVAYQRPVFLRIGYEFDGSWNHYDPETYKQAWIYFYDRMKAQGIDNIALVWQSAANCDGTYQQHPVEAWYPGDEYVDWVGLSYFIQATCDLRPLNEMLDFARQRQKPILISESAPQHYHNRTLTYSVTGRDFEARTAEQIWAEWYAPYFDYIHQNKDIIRAVAYINAYWDAQGMWGPPYPNGYWGDSRVQANELIQQRWLEEITRSFWLHASPDLFQLLGYEP